MDKSKLSRLFIVLAVISAALFYLFLKIGLSQALQGEPSLNFLRPAMTFIVKSYNDFEFNPMPLYHIVLPLVGGLWAICLLAGAVLGKRRIVLVCTLLLFPLLAEGAVLLRHKGLGITLHCIGALYLLVMFMRRRDLATKDGVRTPWRFIEIPLFTTLMLLLCIMRFYLLDRVPLLWDTEMCGDRHIFFREPFSILGHEAGWHPSTTAGAGWLFLHYLLGHLDEPDFYYLYIRLLGTGISVAKFVITFFCVRSLFGAFPAFLSIVLLGFGPPEDWWSREPCFHHLPGLIAVLIFWATARALEHKRLVDFVWIAIFTLLIRFFYASGIFIAFAPFTFFIVLLIFRWSEWRKHLLKIMLLVPSLVGWLLWRSIAKWLVYGRWEWLAPLDIPGHTVLPGGIWGKVYTVIVDNGLDALSALFIQQVNPTHWTVALTTAPARSVVSVVVVLLLVGIARICAARAGQVGLLLLWFVGWSVFSGVTTQVADRRIGVVFVFLIILAAREAGLLVKYIQEGGSPAFSRALRVGLPTALLLYLGWMGAAFRFKVEGLPYQVHRARLLRQFLEPDTLFVQLVIDHSCNAFYGVYRELKSCRMGWSQPTFGGVDSIDSMIENPRINPESWVYQQTDLAACLPSYPQTWRKVVFLLIEGSDTTALLEKLKSRYPTGELKRLEHIAPDGTRFPITGYKVELNPPS